ncbi:hypothetical protein [Ideonella sp. BN130291]|uniref:hypothetical protein n=1 Tax=Ideonella sp. BN130291 TaxID=3112940 RepID=UPI002E254FCD|nr:hypothetical protein [Ideonella sp. BN130291]
MSLTVDQSAEKIHSLVNDDGFLGHNRNDHVKQVAEIFKQASAADSNAIAAKLSDDDLRELAGDVNSGGILGTQGLSGGEKRDLFNELARELDGTQLGRVASAFSDRSDVLALGDAVAGFAPSQTKVDFVKSIAGRATDRSTDIDSGFGYNSLRTGDKEAQAIGSVLSSMKNDPAGFDAAVKALTPDQLAAVVKAGEGEKITTYSGMGGVSAPQTTYDPAGLHSMLEAAAGSHDPAVKARVFEAATKALDDIRGSDTLLTPNPGAKDAAKVVADGLTKLMDSDTRGIVDQLNTNDIGGRALAKYVGELVSEDGSASNPVLGRQIAQLQGAGTGKTATEFINTAEKSSNGDNFYRNAENLGYYAGAIEAGINKLNADDKTKGEILTNIFTTVVGAGTAAVTKMPTAGKVASQVFNGITREVVRQVVADVSSDRKDLRQALTELTLPRDPGQTQRSRSPADPYYQSSANTVVLANQ